MMPKLLLVICGVLLTIAIVNSQGSGDDDSDIGANVCVTQDCYQTASDILSSMDLTVDPCDDFYQYACGRWIQQNPADDGKASVDRYEKLRADNDEFLKKFMANSKSRNEYREIKTVIKAFKYYESCMDTNTIDKRSAQPMESLIQRYGSWSITDNNWDERAWNLQDVLIMMLEDFGTKSLFEFNVELGMTNSSYYYISLKQPTKFSIPREKLNSKNGGAKDRRTFRQFMMNVSLSLGAQNSQKTASMLREVLRFERKLAKSALPEESIDYNKMTIKEVQDMLGTNPIDWLYVIRQVLSDVPINITPETTIILNGKRYFRKLKKHLSNTPKRTLANYMMWKLVYDFYLHLGQDFVDIYHDYKAASGSSWQQPDREVTCMEQLLSMRGFALPLTRVFVDKKFKGNKQWILNATEQIRNEFISNLDNNFWMDRKTNEKAKTKAQSLQEVIGYPDFILNSTALDLVFDDVVIDSWTYFENVWSLKKFWVQKNYELIGKERDNDQWNMSPIEINAQYEDSFNRMVFPVAILQPPFYSGKYSSAVNFGGIGSVIGHELTHGFDDSGKNYDEGGRREDWWTDHTLNEFKKRSKCLVDQYSRYQFHGQNVNGKRSLSENIADNGGLKQALGAYRTWVNINGDEPTLPTTNMTNEQLFFVSFAQNWCASFSSEGINEEMTSNYSPTPIRVNGSLKNFDDFASVFDCAPGKPMNPRSKCGLW
uniref:Membrane metallo-endopeptidase-like 1 n=1 Tax=Actinia tenebrosa TaxID=6105 RepID=A0A6P8IC68_ACTTE